METDVRLETWRFLLPEIVDLLKDDPSEIPDALSGLHPADVGEIINKEVIPLMDFVTAAKLLDAMEPDEQADIVAKLPARLQQNLLQRARWFRRALDVIA